MAPTPQQKEALVKFMEEHTQFAQGRIKSVSNGRGTMKKLRSSVASLLNAMDGDTKDEEGWKKEWSKLRSDAKAAAQSNGKPKSRKTGGGYSSSEDEERSPTTNNDLLDRVLTIIGWECAIGVDIRDELSSDEDEADDTGAECVKASVAECSPNASIGGSFREEVLNAFAANKRARRSLQNTLCSWSWRKHVPLLELFKMGGSR